MVALDPSIQNDIFNIGSGEVYPLKHFVSLNFLPYGNKARTRLWCYSR